MAVIASSDDFIEALFVASVKRNRVRMILNSDWSLLVNITMPAAVQMFS